MHHFKSYKTASISLFLPQPTTAFCLACLEIQCGWGTWARQGASSDTGLIEPHDINLIFQQLQVHPAACCPAPRASPWSCTTSLAGAAPLPSSPEGPKSTPKWTTYFFTMDVLHFLGLLRRFPTMLLNLMCEIALIGTQNKSELDHLFFLSIRTTISRGSIMCN